MLRVSLGLHANSYSKLNCRVAGFFYKKLVCKKLVLKKAKIIEPMVLCMRSIKKLFELKSMDIIANISLNLYS